MIIIAEVSLCGGGSEGGGGGGAVGGGPGRDERREVNQGCVGGVDLMELSYLHNKIIILQTSLEREREGGREELLVWPHEVEPWFHSWYRGRVETLDAKYNLIFR